MNVPSGTWQRWAAAPCGIHSNARALADVVRNLTDCQLLEIRDTNGIVGLNSFNMLVDKDVKEQTVDGLIRHADYIANKIGVEHLAFALTSVNFWMTKLPAPSVIRKIPLQ